MSTSFVMITVLLVSYATLFAADSLFPDAIKSLQTLINLIHQRFELHDEYKSQFFNIIMNMPDYTWDILKYKFAKKIVQGNQQFLMVFGGSSVTAGWDNYYHQSYPMIFEKRMAASFRALGVNLTIHNIAQGDNRCRPSDYCYSSMGGKNPDFIGWEQSYDCGRNPDIFELVARIAGESKAVIHYMASGGFRPKDCKPSSDSVPWISEQWTPESAGITTVYAPTVADVKSKREEIHSWFEDANAIGKFTGPLADPNYKGVGAHGFNIWSGSRSKCVKNPGGGLGTGCQAMDVKGKCQNEGGPHWLSQEAGTNPLRFHMVLYFSATINQI